MNVKTGIKKAASMCVLKHEDQFLLLKRENEPNAGMYAPVGGKLDAFEPPLNAAIRETFEETGIKVKTIKYCGVLTESSPTKYNWISFIYLAEINFIEAPACPEGKLEWVPKEKLASVPTPPTDLAIYQYILKQKPFAFSAEYDQDLKMISLIEEIEGVRILD